MRALAIQTVGCVGLTPPPHRRLALANRWSRVRILPGAPVTRTQIERPMHSPGALVSLSQRVPDSTIASG